MKSNVKAAVNLAGYLNFSLHHVGTFFRQSAPAELHNLLCMTSANKLTPLFDHYRTGHLEATDIFKDKFNLLAWMEICAVDG
jgi:hypothetical protein